MKNVIFKALTVVAMIAAFASCKKDNSVVDPNTGDVTTIDTYGGKDSDGDYLTLVLTTVTTTKDGAVSVSQTYELYSGESKKDKNFEMFSNGSFTMETGGKILFCEDEDGVTSFRIVVDGKTLKYDNGEEGEKHFAFELKRK